ncbi:hypothetical protein O181_029111 [Austropuccinia psidii MF-1]|uniref:Uncharacterized protein n=1 Tax=Austropuccinia psidii MF-1 TaxID=1389203 RepID=A0A9Q3CVU5_9BASI|nr:hypothetical protein [Austropuccinia psidii MF-1]
MNPRKFFAHPPKKNVSIACTSYGNQPMMCVETTCTVPTFGSCLLFHKGGFGDQGDVKPQAFQAYNTCGQLDVWKGTGDGGERRNPHFTCEWSQETDPNNKRPHCKTCYAAQYTPFEYGLCPEKPHLKE